MQTHANAVVTSPRRTVACNLRMVMLMALCGVGIATTLPSVIAARRAIILPENSEVLYLPNGTALKTVGFGYKNFLADVLWFHTVSYFGNHFQTDRNYRWLYHMCSLVVALDPRAKHVYQFGATLLSWELNDAAKSNELLNKAIEEFPNDWLFYYLRGFNYLYFLKDTPKASADFVKASSLPGVHSLVKTLAERTTHSVDGEELGESMLMSLMEITDDPSVRETLKQKLQELRQRKRREQYGY